MTFLLFSLAVTLYQNGFQICFRFFRLPFFCGLGADMLLVH